MKVRTAQNENAHCAPAGAHCTRAVRLRGLACPSGLVGRTFLGPFQTTVPTTIGIAPSSWRDVQRTHNHKASSRTGYEVSKLGWRDHRVGVPTLAHFLPLRCANSWAKTGERCCCVACWRVLTDSNSWLKEAVGAVLDLVGTDERCWNGVGTVLEQCWNAKLVERCWNVLECCPQ